VLLTLFKVSYDLDKSHTSPILALFFLGLCASVFLTVVFLTDYLGFQGLFFFSIFLELGAILFFYIFGCGDEGLYDFSLKVLVGCSGWLLLTIYIETKAKGSRIRYREQRMREMMEEWKARRERKLRKQFDEEWLVVRTQVLKRDNYTCVNCKKTGGRLHVHHIIPRSEEGTDELDNLVTLCAKCHCVQDSKGHHLINSRVEEEDYDAYADEMDEK